MGEGQKVVRRQPAGGRIYRSTLISDVTELPEKTIIGNVFHPGRLASRRRRAVKHSGVASQGKV